MATPPSQGAASPAVPQPPPSAPGAAVNGDAAPPLAAASAAVLVKSEKAPADAPIVVGHDFNADMAAGRLDYDALLQSYATVGFQATHFGQAVDRINDMVCCRGYPGRGGGDAIRSCEVDVIERLVLHAERSVQRQRTPFRAQRLLRERCMN